MPKIPGKWAFKEFAPARRRREHLCFDNQTVFPVESPPRSRINSGASQFVFRREHCLRGIDKKDERFGAGPSEPAPNLCDCCSGAPAAECLEIYGKTSDHQLVSQQVQCQIRRIRETTQPARELVQHYSCRDPCSENRRTACARSGLCLRLAKQCRQVVSAGCGIGRGENAKRLAQHSSVRPEITTVLDGAPNRCPAADGINAAEDHLSVLERWPVAVRNDFDLNCWIDEPELLRRCLDFQFAEVSPQVTLRGDVCRFNKIEVYELDLSGSNGCQLNRNLSADCADSNDADRQFIEFVSRDEIPLACETVEGIHICFSG